MRFLSLVINIGVSLTTCSFYNVVDLRHLGEGQVWRYILYPTNVL